VQLQTVSQGLSGRHGSASGGRGTIGRGRWLPLFQTPQLQFFMAYVAYQCVDHCIQVAVLDLNTEPSY